MITSRQWLTKLTAAALFTVTTAGTGHAANLPPVTSGTLQLWLKADIGVTQDAAGNVNEWDDQSGNANNATQADATLQPKFVSGAVPVSGQPVIRFTGVQTIAEGEYLQGTGQVDIPAGFTSFFVYLRADPTPPREQMAVYLGVPGTPSSGRGYYIRSGFGGGDDEMAFSGWANDHGTGFTIPINTYRIWTLRLSDDQTQLDFFDTDGVSTFTATDTVGSLLTPGAGYYVGGLGSQLRNLQGDIAELIVYKGTLSDADRTAVESYLSHKYFQPQKGPAVTSTSPLGQSVSPSAPISIQIEDSGTQLATNTVQLLLNGSAVVPTMSKPAGTNVTTITYSPPTPFVPGSTNNVRIIFGDTSTPAVMTTNDFSFVVLPGAIFLSGSPTGTAVRANATITATLQDVVTKVVTNTIQLLLNGKPVVPTITQPAGTNLTIITYAPATPLVQGSSNTVRVIFGDNYTPPIFKTNDFGFAVIDEAVAATIVNINFNGQRNVPGPRGPGPGYAGQGAAGGGTNFNQILAISALPDGTDDDNLTVGGTNLLNSIGGATTVSFTVGPVGGDDAGPPATGDPTSPGALLSTYVFNLSAGNTTAQSPFTITGLNGVPFVDIYIYRGNGGTSIPGSSTAPFVPRGIFTTANTVYYPNVPVVNGTVTGFFGPGTAVIYGMTIKMPQPGAFFLSVSPTGTAVTTNAPISVQLEDYVTQVQTNSIQLLLDGQAVVPTISKPAGTNVTTITYVPPTGLASASSNSVRIIFSDNSTAPVFKTNDFGFRVIDEAAAVHIVNIAFNGARNVPGPRGPGPTFVGQGAAGGGTYFNGTPAISQLPDGTDDDNITVGANNLLNSNGGATGVAFTISPVGGDDAGAPPGTDPTSSAALFGQYVFVGSAGQITGKADFTISGLGSAATADLYFYYGVAPKITIPGVTNSTFAATGIFTPANTEFFRAVPVSNGTISGTLGTGTVALLYGLSIQAPAAQGPPPTLSVARQGGGVVITWQGSATLQSASTVNGTFSDVKGASSPYNVTPLKGAEFFRLKQ
jgi:hypothetical protein